ncbi:MAG TPA: hypothetical protein VLJ59_10155 [Mycobacteriales bacterium]|nr:hypothetical protein [Mycobacteriales bacterium]
MQDDAIELIPGRPRISRQAWLTLAMLVLIPTAALLTGVTAVLQVMAESSHPRWIVLLLIGLGMLLLDLVVICVAIGWWLTRRSGWSNAADARGVTVRLGQRTAFLPWDGFDRVSMDGTTLLGWLRPDSLLAAHPMAARMPRRNADEHGCVPLVLGMLSDLPGSLDRLRAWLGRDGVA